MLRTPILGWAQYVGRSSHSIGMETFGASAPLKELQKKFGFTLENVIAAAKLQIAKVGVNDAYCPRFGSCRI